MDNRIAPRISPAGAGPAHIRHPGARSQGNFGRTLADVLKISQHAEQRLRQRGLAVGAEELEGLSQAVAAADRAGSKMAAVVTGETVLVVSPPNRTLVTAVGIQSDRMTLINRVDTLVFVGRTSKAAPAPEGTSSPRRTEGALPAGHWSLWDHATLSGAQIELPGKERE